MNAVQRPSVVCPCLLLALLLVWLLPACSPCREACNRAVECRLVAQKRFEACLRSCAVEKEEDPRVFESQLRALSVSSCAELRKPPSRSGSEQRRRTAVPSAR